MTALLPPFAGTPETGRGMRFVSLFSGIGGFDLGFERAGMKCAAQVEKDAAASTVLKRHFPNAELFEDVKHVGRHNLPAAVLVCGGFPCQDLSVAGRRAGLAGERSGLWFEFLRILTELKPRFCVIENVPGLLSSNGGADFAVVVHGLVECGYRVSWRILDAQYFGVAQRRRRVFVVGSLGDGSSAEILFERESGGGHPEQGEAARQGTAGAATDGAGSGGVYGETGQGYWQKGVQTLRAEGENRPSRPGHVVAKPLLAKAGYRANFGDENYVSTYRMQRSDAYEPATVASTVASRDFKSSTDLVAFAWEASPQNSMNPSELVPTQQSNRTHAVAGSFGVRRLTPRECERLQGFPDQWTSNQSDSARYRQLGNAVCVNVASWLGRRIVAVAALPLFADDGAA